MNNLEALEKMMAGGKIRQIGWYTNTFYELKDGDIVDQDGDIVETFCYDNKSVWEIYKKLEWYNLKENFPIICKVWDNNEHDASYALVSSYIDSDDIFKFNTIDKKIWKNAVRVSTNGNPL